MKTLVTLSLLSIALIYSSCCTKQLCLVTYGFELHGFDSSDLAGAYTLRENDTSALRWNYSEDSSFFYINDIRIDDNIPVTCVMPAVDRTFLISNFRYKKQKCNDCFLAKDNFEEFSGCDVNGQPQEGTTIRLYK